MDRPIRKSNRLKNYDYSTNGVYFITICTNEKCKILCDIVGDGVLDVPIVQLTSFGSVADRQIQCMNNINSHIRIDKYVIMPNHIHILLSLQWDDNLHKGSSRTPTPTNDAIPQFVSTFKRFCNRQYGQNIWQRSYHDHIIRNEQDYLKFWQYIDTNPAKWTEDRFYTE